MVVIDRKMYKTLKNWCDFQDECRPRNQRIMYINSCDSNLTNATIRKVMYELHKEDIHGELYQSFFSVENYYHNMRDYYSEISKLYFCDPAEDASLLDIIKEIPPTCGWIILIVKDIEAFSEECEKMEEMMKTIMKFSTKNASIILIGNGSYKDIFSGCEYALKELEDGFAAKEGDNLVMIGSYNQEITPERENVVYKTPDEHRDELNYYWDILYEQLKHKYFDYDSFRVLFKESLEYIIPRVSRQKVYRKDLKLIENIGAVPCEDNKNIDGCKPWEFDAAEQFSRKVHSAIVNKYNYNDDLSAGIMEFRVVIKEPMKDYGAIHISGSMIATIKVNVDTVCDEMEELSETIYECTYIGDVSRAWEYEEKKYHERNNIEESDEQKEKSKGLFDSLNSLEDAIKGIADKTINKEPGKKVRRCKDSRN